MARTWWLVPIVMVAACGPQSLAAPMPPDDTADGIDFGQVAIRVKQEVGFYLASQPVTDADWQKIFIASGLYDQTGAPPSGGVCGSGKIRLDIQKVEMDLIVNYDNTKGVSGGLKIPFGVPGLAASAGPGGGASQEDIGSVEVKFTYYVPPTPETPAAWAFLRQNPSIAVVKTALESLRNGLIAAAGHKPCFQDRAKEQKSPDPGTAVFSVRIKRNANLDIGFNVWLVKLSANDTAIIGQTNKIIVTYVPTVLGQAEPSGAHAMMMKAPRPPNAGEHPQ